MKFNLTHHKKKIRYFVNPWDIFTYWTYILETDPKFLENVTFTIYKPNYGTDFRLYPINKLRNIGILQSLTDYIFVIDADFVPDPVLYQNAKKVVFNIHFLFLFFQTLIKKKFKKKFKKKNLIS